MKHLKSIIAFILILCALLFVTAGPVRAFDAYGNQTVTQILPVNTYSGTNAPVWTVPIVGSNTPVVWGGTNMLSVSDYVGSLNVLLVNATNNVTPYSVSIISSNVSRVYSYNSNGIPTNWVSGALVTNTIAGVSNQPFVTLQFDTRANGTLITPKYNVPSTGTNSFGLYIIGRLQNQ